MPEEPAYRSLERRSSKKLEEYSAKKIETKLPAPPSFTAFEKTIEKSNSIQDRIEATLSKHNVGPKQVTGGERERRCRDAKCGPPPRSRPQAGEPGTPV